MVNTLNAPAGTGARTLRDIEGECDRACNRLTMLKELMELAINQVSPTSDTYALEGLLNSMSAMVDVDIDRMSGVRQCVADMAAQSGTTGGALLRMEDRVPSVADPLDPVAGQPPATSAAKNAADRDREHHARQAMSYAIMTVMELHARSGTSEQAYDLADKALGAIGALRVMTQGGRVQA